MLAVSGAEREGRVEVVGAHALGQDDAEGVSDFADFGFNRHGITIVTTVDLSRIRD